MLGLGMIIIFILYFSEISVFALSVMAVSFLKRSNRFTVAVAAGAASAYIYYMWALVDFQFPFLH